jgi:putative addiction module killer protein
MFEIEQTEVYKRWFAKLRDEAAKARVDIRIRRLRMGNAGDARPIGRGVSELRIDYGAGYRVYFMRKDQIVILLLAGGDERTQFRDIRLALELAEVIRSEK